MRLIPNYYKLLVSRLCYLPISFMTIASLSSAGFKECTRIAASVFDTLRVSGAYASGTLRGKRSHARQGFTL
ncbi:MAG: hypothetical protein KME59_17550 [Trichormus sp. ATA11-4-KO1]|nr:hypothetical protein [Trichormus sp. ATA11-4-KO1]